MEEDKAQTPYENMAEEKVMRSFYSKVSPAVNNFDCGTKSKTGKKKPRRMTILPL